MRRMLWAGLLALPVVLAMAEPVKAQGCASCGPFAAGRPNAWSGSPFRGPFGCNGFCLSLFGTWLQDGPLVNYGPYEGYYPFTPYGPWTSDLRYTGPARRGGGGTPSCGWCGRGGCGGGCGVGGHLSGLLHKRECGNYALATLRNVGHRCQPCGSGCATPSADCAK
ncbi:MAG: hypothetical protein MUF18_00015 [Fimbriiglobus sp.]|nr:hypothetical protein [Fimbriiglobus sp.]